MSDIVARLRDPMKNFDFADRLIVAHEIEKLGKAIAAERAANADIVMLKQAADEIARLRTQNEVMSADNERLRAALERLVAYLERRDHRNYEDESELVKAARGR